MSIARPPVSDRVSRPAEDDLPDIIDIVMEMGRADSDLPKQPPSPPLQPASGLPAHLEKLADRARDYVEAASSANTRRAYAADWKHFCAWTRRQNLEVLPPDPQVVGLYITACASGKATGDRKPNAVATIERRLSSLTWNYTQRGQPLDRKDRHIATVLAGIRNTHALPPGRRKPSCRRTFRHAGDARPRHVARPARPGHAAAWLCRRPAAFRDRRPRRCQGSHRRRARLGGFFSTKACW